LKKRIDLILVDRGIAYSRNHAQNLIKEGNIKIHEKQVLKSNEIYETEIVINLEDLKDIWVSRGAIKLNHALDHFKIDVTNFNCLDLGASTGGFTEVLLSKNAKKIFSVDVGTDQLHSKLKNNPKILNIDQTNARYLNDSIITELVDIIVCDVSFISMKKVISPCLLFLKPQGVIVALIKPQFESEKKNIRRGGIITDSNIHKEICNEYIDWFTNEHQMNVLGITTSPIKGQKGNIEFLIYISK